MRRGLRVASLLAGLALAPGCANPVNEVTFWRYHDAALAAHDAGDLQQAKIYWSRAVINARIGHLGPDRESLALYNYGIVVGHMCEFENARDSFVAALELTEREHGPGGDVASMRLFELARLHCAHGQDAQCAVWYDRAIPLTLSRPEVVQSDPIAVANELERYAGALERSGAPDRAREMRERSTQLRDGNPGARAKFVVDEYPTTCRPVAVD